jgi:hypothetical protein
VPVYERFKRPRNVEAIPAALIGNQSRYFYRHIPRPALGGIECDHLDRIGIMSIQQVGDKRFTVAPIFVGFAPGSSDRLPEIIQH